MTAVEGRSGPTSAGMDALTNRRRMVRLLLAGRLPECALVSEGLGLILPLDGWLRDHAEEIGPDLHEDLIRRLERSNR